MTDGELAMIIINWRKNLDKHQMDLVDAFGNWELDLIFGDNDFEQLHRWYNEWKEWHPEPEYFPKAGDQILAKFRMNEKIFSGKVLDVGTHEDYPAQYVLLKKDSDGEVIKCLESLFLFKIVKKS